MAHPAYDLSQLRQLSVPERLQLVEDLWDTIAADSPDDALPMTPELAAELDRRVTAHEAAPSAAVPWDVVRAELLGGAAARRADHAP